jgi:hypothetical protein
MSIFSSIVRKASGGSSIGEVAGGFIGGAIGGPTGATIGRSLGGAATQELSQRSEIGQGTAVSQDRRPAQETSTSGSTDAQNLYARPPVGGITNISFNPAGGMIAPQLQPRQVTRQNIQPARGVAGFVGGVVAGAAPMIVDFFTGEPKKLIVTRKLKSQVKRSVDLMGIEATADGMGVDVSVVNYILLKKLRNDGAYVTKAAMRKTSSTLRKMKRMCDMYDDLRPAARRRAPARKSSSIMQVKN